LHALLFDKSGSPVLLTITGGYDGTILGAAIGDEGQNKP
jgi:hypothetical protein